MPATVKYAISYPSGSTAPNVPIVMQSTAESVEAALSGLDAEVTALQSATTPNAKYQPSLKSGWSHLTGSGWTGLWIIQQGKLVLISGAVSKSSWATADIFCTVPSAYKPIVQTRGIGADIDASGNLLMIASGTGSLAITVSYFVA